MHCTTLAESSLSNQSAVITWHSHYCRMSSVSPEEGPGNKLSCCISGTVRSLRNWIKPLPKYVLIVVLICSSKERPKWLEFIHLYIQLLPPASLVTQEGLKKTSNLSLIAVCCSTPLSSSSNHKTLIYV